MNIYYRGMFNGAVLLMQAVCVASACAMPVVSLFGRFEPRKLLAVAGATAGGLLVGTSVGLCLNQETIDFLVVSTACLTGALTALAGRLGTAHALHRSGRNPFVVLAVWVLMFDLPLMLMAAFYRVLRLAADG